MSTAPTAGTVAAAPRWMTVARRVYTASGWLFVAGVVVQVYFAGLGLLVDPAHLRLHTSFAHFVELLPVAMLICAFVGRLGRRIIVWTSVLLLLFISQYILIYTPIEIGAFATRALHPTNALALFGVGIYLARKGRHSPHTDEPPRSEGV